MAYFLTRVVIQDGQAVDYEALSRAMHAQRFFTHIVGSDNTPYLLPPYTYFSFGDSTVAQVRNLAEASAQALGKPLGIVTVAFAPEQISWRLETALPKLPPIIAQAPFGASAGEAGKNDLLEMVEKTMDKVRPLAETTAKVASDFGQLLIKGCATLNAGALVAMPTLFKALAGSNTSTPRSISFACIAFGAGLLSGAFAAWAAFVFTTQTTKMLTRSLQLPMLQAQLAFNPASMDTMQRKRLSQAERSTRWTETVGAAGLWVVSLACLVSVICLLVGAYYGGSAILSLDIR